jgi:hypothetical protein
MIPCCTCKKKSRPGESGKIALEARDGIGNKVELRSVRVCSECFKKIAKHEGQHVMDEGGDLAAALDAMFINDGSYLATYAKHLARRLRELEVETHLKDAALERLGDDLAAWKGRAESFERAARQCGCKACKEAALRLNEVVGDTATGDVPPMNDRCKPGTSSTPDRESGTR